MSKKKAAGNQVGQVPSPSLLQGGRVCYLEATQVDRCWAECSTALSCFFVLPFFFFLLIKLFITGG